MCGCVFGIEQGLRALVREGCGMHMGGEVRTQTRGHAVLQGWTPMCQRWEDHLSNTLVPSGLDAQTIRNKTLEEGQGLGLGEF